MPKEEFPYFLKSTRGGSLDSIDAGTAIPSSSNDSLVVPISGIPEYALDRVEGEVGFALNLDNRVRHN